MTSILQRARKVIRDEIDALSSMSERLNAKFEEAVGIISKAGGRLVIVGMGKSGIVGRKIAATMASTGTPAFFVHPGEAFHGDLGMIKSDDVVLLISNSGETEELLRLIPFLQYQENRVIAMTGKIDSTLARNANVVLDVGVEREACSNNLAPTSSTTATLVMGDALAVTLSEAKGFQPEDFARFHPGGSLGRRLLTRVVDVMRKDDLPFCSSTSSFREVIHVVTQGKLGLCLVVREKCLVGLITDGDIRRAFESHEDPLSLVASQFMSTDPKTINDDSKLVDAEEKMLRFKVNALVVLKDSVPVGVVQLQGVASAV